MKILEQYIGKVVISYLIIVLLILVSLDTFLAFVSELSDVGDGNYRLTDATIYILFTLPRRIYLFLPVSTLLGCLLGLGALANQSELVIVRAAGISWLNLMTILFKSLIWVVLLILALGQWGMPMAEQYARSMKEAEKTGRVTLASEYGFWAKDGLTFVNIAQILPPNQLRHLTIYEMDQQHRLRVATYARSAHYEQGIWHLKNIKQSWILPERVVVKHLKQADWNSILEPDLLSVVVVEPEILSITGLFKYIQFLKQAGLETLEYELAFWHKLMAPVHILVMLFLSIPFLLGSTRVIAMGQRILTGALVAISFTLLDKASGYMALVYHLNPIVFAVLPSGLFLLFGIWRLKKVY